MLTLYGPYIRPLLFWLLFMNHYIPCLSQGFRINVENLYRASTSGVHQVCLKVIDFQCPIYTCARMTTVYRSNKLQKNILW